jgi:plasmid maintenance system antidote protein VapI
MIVPAKQVKSGSSGLSAYSGMSDGYWINLQAHFDLEMAKDKVGKLAASSSARLI